MVRPAHDNGGLERSDVVDGVAGNTRLTSATGLVLVALLAIEGVTILSVRQMITLHIFVGVMLLGPVLLKSGSTFYRFARYYTGSPEYRRKGPPSPLHRILGPVVIGSSLSLLGTGVALIFAGDQGSGWLLVAHQTCFWVWVVVIAVHVVGHLWEAAVTAWKEIRGSLSGRAATRRRWRFMAIALALVLGVGAATTLMPTAASWTNRSVEQHFRPAPRP
jgi:hypothetical protein